VELLVQFFVQKLARKLGRPPLPVPADVLRRLRAYSWPGNVRELQNVIERAIVLARGVVLTVPELVEGPGPGAPARAAAALPTVVASETTGSDSLVGVERRHIETVLIERNWMIEGERGAAKALDIHPNTLRGRMRKLGLKRPAAS
jgi:transcriptional regulator with GAF, ATPase, and Fis domain